MDDRHSFASGALQRYPLRITIPCTQRARSALSVVPHHVFVICIDDCGKVYEGATPRRFSDFVRLHTALRELACALPELPAKKVFGNLKEDFVAQRRQRLEDYLNALLLQPIVVQDDTIWRFLDIRLATAVVPRFLCKPSSISECEKILATLLHELVTRPVRELQALTTSQARSRSMSLLPGRSNSVERSNSMPTGMPTPSSSRTLGTEPFPELFRLCNQVAIQSLVDFTKSEAEHATTVTPAQVSARQDLVARMRCRSHLGKLLKPLVMRTSAWPGLQEAGMFGALLALLRRATEDAETSEDSTIKGDCKNICGLLNDCLVSMIQVSKGNALVHFMEQQDGLGVLCHAAENIPALHKALGLFLWTGLAFDDVVELLVAHSERALTLMDTLFTSHDIQANILSSLCVCRILRHPAGHILAPELQQNLVNSLSLVPGYLESAEEEACGRAAEQMPAAGPTGRGNTPARDPRLTALLQTLCCGQDLERLEELVGDLQQPSDSITELVVAVLYHFAEHSASELEALRNIMPIAHVLHELVVSTAASDQVRKQAAVVLTHLGSTALASTPTGEPQSLGISGLRAAIFEVLHQHTQAVQQYVASGATQATEHAQEDDDLIQAHDLGRPPCIEEACLEEFIQMLRALQTSRSILQQRSEASKAALRTLQESLERTKTSDAVLASELRKLREDIRQQMSQEKRCEVTSQELADAEASHKEAVSQSEANKCQEEEMIKNLQECEEKLLQAQQMAAARARAEEDLARIRETAPVELVRIEAQLQACQAKLDTTAEARNSLESQRQEKRHRSSQMETDINDAKNALARIDQVKQKLRGFREQLTSETVMSQDEKQVLLDLEMELPRRATLPHAAEDNALLQADALAEQDFNAAPNFRSFSRLCEERAETWKCQCASILAQRDSIDASQARLEKEQQNTHAQELALKQEIERLRVEHEQLADLDGHARRHQEACDAHADARQDVNSIIAEKSQLDVMLEQRKATLKEALSREQEEKSKLTAAKECHSTESAVQGRLRLEAQARLTELWTREKDHMRDLGVLSLEKHHVLHRLQQVQTSFKDEEQARALLWGQAQLLSRSLHDLEDQLTFSHSN